LRLKRRPPRKEFKLFKNNRNPQLQPLEMKEKTRHRGKSQRMEIKSRKKRLRKAKNEVNKLLYTAILFKC